MRAPTWLILSGLAAVAAMNGQTFEVASVKPNRAGNSGGEGGARESISFNPGSLTMRNVTLKSCIRWAYGVADYQVSGPPWIGSQHYDIEARAGSAVSPEQLRLMLRELLASRFQVALHRESRDLPVYELTAASAGSRLQRSEGEGAAEMRPGDGDLIYRHYSMADFAEQLAGIPFRVERTVVDKTGLEGTYDFRLKISTNEAEMKNSFEHADGPVVFDVLRQIGLRLQARRDPVEVLVIDRAEKNPAEK